MQMQGTPTSVAEYVKSRGYRAEPLLNTIAAAEGQPLKVVGYTLHGPRGNKKVVGTDELFAAKLWCDGVDYATSRIKVA